MGKTPAFQFYPGDWLRSEVAGCSIGAQGLWLRLLIVMHDCERYGYASQNGKPMSNAALARRCGVGLEEFNDLLAELEDAGVFSREEDGTIFSRRMARDEIERKANAERQRRHRDNSREDRNGDVTHDVTPVSQDCHTPSSSSSSSSCTTNVVQREGPVLEAQTAVAAPAPQPKPKPKTQSLAPPTAKPNRDPALDASAVQVYRETFKRTPNEAQRAEIQKRVTDLNHYRTTLANWQLSGWNPGNVLGQLDRYEQTKPKIEDQTLTVQQPECVALAATGTGGMANYGQPIQRHQPKTFAQLNTEENARRLNGNASIREQIRTGALQLPRIGKTG